MSDRKLLERIATVIHWKDIPRDKIPEKEPSLSDLLTQRLLFWRRKRSRSLRFRVMFGVMPRTGSLRDSTLGNWLEATRIGGVISQPRLQIGTNENTWFEENGIVSPTQRDSAVEVHIRLSRDVSDYPGKFMLSMREDEQEIRAILIRQLTGRRRDHVPVSEEDLMNYPLALRVQALFALENVGEALMGLKKK